MTRSVQLALDDLVRNAPVGMVLFDTAARYRFLNDRVVEMTGISLQAVEGRRVSDVLPDMWPQVEPIFEQVLEGAASVEADMTGELPREPGVTRTWHTTWYPVRTQGEVTSVAVIFEDVTGQRRTEEVLGAALAARDEFVSFVSHELRGPLTIIQGYASLLNGRRELQDMNLWSTAISEIFTESMRLNEIISNLLALARLEQGTQVSVEPIILRHTLRRIVREFQEAARRDVGLHLPEDITPVLGNDGLLDQVLRNLLSNAVKYSPPDSAIEVEVTQTPELTVVSVTDEGPGLQAGDAEKVFDMFYRSGKEADKPGMGIGLTVCRRLLEAMGGEIWADARQGPGATFSFSLPTYGPTASRQG